jgi:PKD repeat protein
MKNQAFLRFLLFLLLAGIFFIPYASAESNPVATVSYQGRLVDIRSIGPGLPPDQWIASSQATTIQPQGAAANIIDVPTLNWSYGCSATSAAMLFGYWDRHGYSNMYTGPTNGGVFPSTNNPWGESLLFPGHGECPLSATHQGIDGRVVKGHVDDYWSSYGSVIDPYFGSWTEHSDFPAVCTGDFMGTNQYQCWHSTDGSTWFVYYSDNSKCYDFTGWETVPAPAPVSHVIRDGAHGMRLFVESRGYTTRVNGVYNQYIYGYRSNPAGFTYAEYKTQIDEGNPVFIQLSGHTMLGVGYDDNAGENQVIVHDTWDHADHTMVWGGLYGGMAHLGVTVVQLNIPSNQPPHAEANGPYEANPGQTITFSSAGSMDPDGSIVSYDWNWGDGTAQGSGAGPTHAYSTSGMKTVTLTVTDNGGATGTDTATVTIRTPCEDINDLKATVKSLTLSPTIRTALNTRLNKASTLCAKGSGQYRAIVTLFKGDFIPYVNSKTGKGITPAQATTLLNQANLIIAACGG